ncbi:MAG: Gfo/Idh/MocA family protein [Phycisphaerae bacterium]
MSDRRIKVGIVGGGRVGEGFTRNLQRQPDMDVVGVVTRTPARQQEFLDKYGVPGVGTTEELMAMDDRPEVVCVVNANEDHCPSTIAALEGGAHVYLEKPMAPTLEECVHMVEAEKRTGKHIQVGFEYMHGTMTSRLKELVDEGYFGDVLWATVLDSRGHWWSIDPNEPREKIWKLDRRRGGGIIFHCGIHQLDMIRSYLGPIDEVTAYTPPVNPLPFYPDDVPANVTLMLKAANGAVANFQVFHDRAPTYYREAVPFHPDWRQVPGHEFDVSLVGNRASCKMSIYGEQLHLFRFDLENKDTVFERTEVFSPNVHDKSHHDMAGLLLRFLRQVSAGQGPIDSSQGALETMRLAFASEDALTQPGKTVHVKDYR